MIEIFLDGLPPNYFFPEQRNGRPLENDPSQSRFVNNGIEMFVQVDDEGDFHLRHICPMNSTNQSAAYNEPPLKDNVSAIYWMRGTYAVPEWPRINPASALAKAAYDEEMKVRHLGNENDHRGFDLCKAVFARAENLLVAHKKTLKSAHSAAASEPRSPKRDPLRFTRKKYEEMKTLIHGAKDAIKHHRLLQLVSQAGTVMEEFRLNSEFLTKTSYSGKEERQLKKMLGALDRLVDERIPPDSPKGPAEAPDAPDAPEAPAEAPEAPEALAKIAHAKRKTKGRKHRKPRKSTLRARRRTRVV